MIMTVDEELKRNALGFSSSTLRYRFPDTYFFNSYYHPNKKGVDLRTKLVIEDLETVFANTGKR